MENFVVKKVGAVSKTINKNEFIMKHGEKLSIALMNQPFIESAMILNEDGNMDTTITKE